MPRHGPFRAASRRIALAVALAALPIAGCGYRVGGQGDLLPAHLRILAVPAFENHTSWMGAEQRLTDAVVRELIRRTNYDIVGNPDGADAVLTGKVLSSRSLPAVFDPATGRASVVQIELRIAVVLRDLRENIDLFVRDDYVFREDYEISSDLDSFFEERNPALGRLSEEFAAALVSAMLEDF